MFNEIINYINQGKFKEAEKKLKNIINKNPDSDTAYYLMGYINLKINRIEDSLKFFKKALDINEKTDYLFAYAEVLTRKNLYYDAENCYKKILSKEPRNEPSTVNLAYIYLLTKNFVKSEEYYLKAIQLNSHNANYYKNIANLYRKQNKLNDAIKNYDIGINLDSKNPEIKKGKGLTLLSQKKYETAWDFFEGRIYSRQNMGPLFAIIKNKIFNGDSLQSAKKLVVVSEQGIGDKILFSSFYSELLNLNKQVKFLIDPRLNEIYQRSFGTYEYIDLNNLKRVKELINENYQFIYAGSLGKFFRKNINDFNGNAFFQPNPKKISEYKSILKKNNFKKYIGLSWKSSAKFTNKKSLSINDFQSIINEDDYGIVNLQYGELNDLEEFNLKNNNRIIKIGGLDEFNDLDSMISLIHCLDLVITSPNVTIHLAGSVGKKCLGFYHNSYESIFNSPTQNNNEWYRNFKIVQFENDLKNKIEIEKKFL